MLVKIENKNYTKQKLKAVIGFLIIFSLVTAIFIHCSTTVHQVESNSQGRYRADPRMYFPEFSSGSYRSEMGIRKVSDQQGLEFKVGSECSCYGDSNRFVFEMNWQTRDLDNSSIRCVNSV